MKRIKRIIAIILAFVMAAAVPVAGYAAQEDIVREKMSLEHTGGYIPHQIKADTSEPASDRHTMLRVPASYDLRNRLPAVRNQGDSGMCWAFATIASAESNLIMKRKATSSIDLSELQLAYFTYHRVIDPLGGLKGDTVTLDSSENYLEAGGNMYISSETLSKRCGLVEESKAPFNSSKPLSTYTNWSPASSLAYSENSYKVTDSFFVSLNNRNAVKNMIMQYGAAAVSYYHNSTYLNYTTNAYCVNSKTIGNHAVCIVGWDDNYSRSNFKSQYRPKSDGAWIVRNSWSSTWGDNGYFYLSYEDQSLGYDGDSDAKYAYFFVAEPSDTSERVYQYDGGLTDNMIVTVDEGYAANIYTAKRDEILKSVNIMCPDPDTDYKVCIYTDVSNENPVSGKRACAWQTGKMYYIGHKSVELSTPVYLSSGRKYSVVVCYSRPNKFLRIPVDSDDDWGELSFDVTSYPNQSFCGADMATWIDLHKKDYTARIKAETVPVNENYIRIFGNSRYETAGKICDYGRTSAGTVVIASGLDYADALCSVPYAAALDAPILLTAGKTPEKEITERLSALGTRNVIIIGGTGRISEAFAENIADIGCNVSRIAGSDRFETCVLVAKEIGKIKGDIDKFAIATGTGYADALSISPYAAMEAMPIIYSHPGRGLPEVCMSYMEFNCESDESVYIIGGEGSVPESAESYLNTICSDVTRICGTNRFATSLAVFEQFSDSFSNDIMLATGNDFPDALAGGVLAAKLRTPIILVNSKNGPQFLADEAVALIKSRDPESIYILGGIGAVPDGVKAQLG